MRHAGDVGIETPERHAGTVREWHDEQGWGVLDSPATPGGCWAHFSAVQLTGYRTLTPGAAVRFVFERADQDGFAFRAVQVFPPGVEAAVPPSIGGPSGAYRSTLTITFDDPDAPAQRPG